MTRYLSKTEKQLIDSLMKEPMASYGYNPWEKNLSSSECRIRYAKRLIAKLQNIIAKEIVLSSNNTIRDRRFPQKGPDSING